MEKSIYLLLLSNSENSCYVLIKDFNRFMTNKAKPHGKKHFVDIAYYAFLSSNYWNVILKVFWQWTTQNQGYFLKKINTLVFIKRLIKAPFIIYGDVECVSSPSADNNDVGSNTRKYEDHGFLQLSLQIL